MTGSGQSSAGCLHTAEVVAWPRRGSRAEVLATFRLVEARQCFGNEVLEPPYHLPLGAPALSGSVLVECWPPECLSLLEYHRLSSDGEDRGRAIVEFDGHHFPGVPGDMAWYLPIDLAEGEGLPSVRYGEANGVLRGEWDDRVRACRCRT